MLLVLFPCLFPNRATAQSPNIYDVPYAGPPGSQSTVLGKGFDPNATIDVYFDSTNVGFVVSDGNGRFGMSLHGPAIRKDGGLAIQIPKDAVPGQHWITAVERITQLQAQAAFTVSVDWAQYQFDAPRTGFNPYENVLSPSTVGNLTLRWTYPTGQFGGLSTPPIVANGAAYVSEADFFALNASTGALLWDIVPPPSYGLPAVVNGVVYTCGGGQGWGGVWALNASTGVPIWYQGQYKGCYGAPTFVDGVLYVNGAAPGGVSALNASTGALLWNWYWPNWINGSPTVANGMVYVGSDHVYALNAATGVLVWTSINEGAPWTLPVVANGLVYVGYNDYNLYALNAATGALVWQDALPDGVGYDMAVANGVVYAPSYTDALYAFNAATGSFLYKTTCKPNSPPTVANGVVYFGSGYNVCAVDAGTGAVLWQYPTGYWVSAATAVNGMLYVASQDGNLYAFGLPNQQMSEKVQPARASRPGSTDPQLEPTAEEIVN